MRYQMRYTRGSPYKQQMLRLPQALSLSLSLILAASAASLPHAPSAEPLIEAGHYKRARAVLAARLQENPNDAYALYLTSKDKQSLGDLRGATAAAEKAVALDPRSADFHAQLAECYAYTAEKSSWVRALSLVHQMKDQINAALSVQPHHTDTLLVAMMFYFHAPKLAGGDRQKAHEIAQEIVTHDPRWGYLAQARLAQEGASDAQIETALKQAVQADPTHYRATYELARFYCCVAKSPNVTQAERAGRQLLTLDASRGGGYAILASAYATAHRWSDLDAVIDASLKGASDDLAPFFEAAKVLIAENQELPRAQKYLHTYLSQEPEGRQPGWAEAKVLLKRLQ